MTKELISDKSVSRLGLRKVAAVMPAVERQLLECEVAGYSRYYTSAPAAGSEAITHHSLLRSWKKNHS